MRKQPAHSVIIMMSYFKIEHGEPPVAVQSGYNTFCLSNFQLFLFAKFNEFQNNQRVLVIY